MREITAYKTVDGKIFEDLREAHKHEDDFELLKWYVIHELRAWDGANVKFDSIKIWLRDNREMVKKIIG